MYPLRWTFVHLIRIHSNTFLPETQLGKTSIQREITNTCFTAVRAFFRLQDSLALQEYAAYRLAEGIAERFLPL